METLYVYNQDTGSFVQADEWLKDADPKRAQLIGIKTDRGMLVLEKKDLGEHTFAKAQAVAEAHKVEGFDQGFRCPTRREVIDIQDAIDAGLHDLMDAIGGDSLLGDWCWTSERFSENRWFARRYYANTAWIFYGTSGNLYNSSTCTPAFVAGRSRFYRPKVNLNLRRPRSLADGSCRIGNEPV